MVSATQAGRSLPSISTVHWYVMRMPPFGMSSAASSFSAADARTNLHGAGETDFVRAVVYAVPHIVDLEDIPAEGGDHGQGKIAVCDGLAIRHVRLAALDIDMDPLMVAACLGERVDAFLCHDQPVADPQLLTDQRLHRLRALNDSLRHDVLPQTNESPTDLHLCPGVA